MPSRLIHENDGMCAGCDGAADLAEVTLHRMGVGGGHHDRSASSTRRADGTKKIGALIALIGGLAGSCAFFGPLPHGRVLLPEAHVVLKPELDWGAVGDVLECFFQRGSEFF